MTSTLNIHPSAAANFDSKATAIVDLVKEITPETRQSNSFPSEQHVAGTITDDDILCDIGIHTADYKGNIVETYFQVNNIWHGLDKESYINVIKLSENIQSLPTVRKSISTDFVRETLVSWVKLKFQNLATPDSFTAYLDNVASSEIETIISWIPVASLEVEIPFPVSNSEIRPLSKAAFDTWAQRIGEAAGERKDDVLDRYNKMRKDFQGLAAIVTTTTAEPEHALTYSLEEALRITSILGIFSDAMLLPDIKCVSTVKGFETLARATAFFEHGNGNITSHSRLVDAPSAFPWRLDRNKIHYIRRFALDKISHLLGSDELNIFEKSVLNYLLLYSKTAFTADPIEKVVHILSSLESILLKNVNEPIQQNLSERIAVFTTQELEERKTVIKTIKSAYSIRSGYLHHGSTSHELEVVSDLMICAKVFFIQLIKNIDRFTNKDEFVTAIDDRKLS